MPLESPESFERLGAIAWAMLALALAFAVVVGRRWTRLRSSASAPEPASGSPTEADSPLSLPGMADASSRLAPPDRRMPSERPPGPVEALLAEDNDVNALVLTRHLEKLGCRVTRAATGAEAVSAASKGAFEIVFMDWRMPEMDGLDAIRHIRRLEGCSTVPIVAVTANALPGDRETCLRAGADEYVTKPVDAAGLRATLDRFGLLASASESPTASDRSTR